MELNNTYLKNKTIKEKLNKCVLYKLKKSAVKCGLRTFFIPFS